MPFVLQSFEPLSVGIRRLLGEQLASVHRHLLSQNAQAGEGADPTFAIHEARKGLKRCRTLLRLLRRALGRDEAQALGAKLRDLGRLLSPYRDRHMLAEAAARLAEKTAASPFAEALGPVRSALSEQDLLQPIPEEILRTLLPVLRSVAATLETRLRELDEAREIVRLHRDVARDECGADVAGRAQDLGLERRLGDLPAQCVLATAAADDEDLHGVDLWL